MLTSTDRAGNAQRSRFQFFIPSARHVTDHDQLDNPPTHDQPPHFGQPTQANVWSWGSVGSGGGWGTWSLSNSGGGSGGTFTPMLVGPAQPVGLPAAPQSGTAPLSGSGYEYAESIRDIVDRAVDFISVSPETATKKAALDHRESILDALGERLDTLIHHDGNFYNDRALVERLRPVLHGLFAAAYDPRDKGLNDDGSPIDRAGVEPAFADLEAGWLAQSVVKDPLSVRVQVFQATLLAVVTEATPLVTDVAQQQALAAAVMELAKTYAWLNPHPEATVPVGEQDFGFLDALWRLQIPDANGVFKDSGVIAQTLAESVAAVGRLLAGVQEPVRTIQFLNNLVQAATNVTSLQGDVKDATFLRELVEFGVEVAKVNPVATYNFSEDLFQGFVDRLWLGEDVQQMHQAQGELSEFFNGFDTKDKRLDLLESEQKLFTVVREAEVPQELLQDLSYINGLLQFGSYYPLTQPSTEQDDIFFDIWEAQTDEELQSVVSSLKSKSVNLPDSFIVASSNNYSESLKGPLANVNAYWIPSTDTLFEMEDSARIAFFKSLLNESRTSQINTVYLDVLAPKGATVHRNGWGSDPKGYTGDTILDILENQGFHLGADDVINEFKSAANQSERSSGIRLSAWIEGSGLVATQKLETRDKPGSDNSHGGEYTNGQYYNKLFEIARDNNGLFDSVQSAQGKQVDYVDLLKDKVYEYLKGFIVDIANRSGVSEIMLDDHFGIPKEYLNAAITKYADKVANANPSNTALWLRQGITNRLSDLKNELSKTGKDLSISVNPFNFDDGGSAMSINNQDVAAWLEQKLITGTLNVQIYRNSFQSFKDTYDTLSRQVHDYLSKKQRELGQDFESWLKDFPQISISIAQTGGDKTKGTNWVLDLDSLQAQANYVNNHSQIYPSVGSVPALKASVVGFDFHRFENLANGTVIANEKTGLNTLNSRNIDNGAAPWGKP